MNIQHHTYRPITVGSLFTAHNSQAENYAFASKERDVETGLSYFGARYYSSDLSIWLSVDPMVDKYPSLSPYVYCANNPVKLVDPNGEEIVIWISEKEKYTYIPGSQCPSSDKNVQAAWVNLDKMYGTEAGKTVIDEMTGEGSPTFTVTNESLRGDGTGRFQADGKGGGTMYMGGKMNEGDYVAHELFHGYQEMKGQGGASIHNEVEANLFAMLTVNGGFILGPKDGTKKNDPYSDAFTNFQCNRVNESNFDTSFNVLMRGFKSESLANKGKLYERFDIGENTPSLIKSFYK